MTISSRRLATIRRIHAGGNIYRAPSWGTEVLDELERTRDELERIRGLLDAVMSNNFELEYDAKHTYLTWWNDEGTKYKETR